MRETRALSIAPSAMLAASERTDPAAKGALDSVVDALAAKTFLLPVDHMRGGEGEPEPVERAYGLGARSPSSIPESIRLSSVSQSLRAPA